MDQQQIYETSGAEDNLIEGISDIENPIRPLDRVYEYLATEPGFDDLESREKSQVVAYVIINYFLKRKPFGDDRIQSLINEVVEVYTNGNLEQSVDFLIKEYLDLVLNKSQEDQIRYGHANEHIRRSGVQKLGSAHMSARARKGRLGDERLHSVMDYDEAHQALKDMFLDVGLYELLVENKRGHRVWNYTNSNTYQTEILFRHKNIKGVESEGITVVLEINKNAHHVVIRTLYPTVDVGELERMYSETQREESAVA